MRSLQYTASPQSREVAPFSHFYQKQLLLPAGSLFFGVREHSGGLLLLRCSETTPEPEQTTRPRGAAFRSSNQQLLVSTVSSYLSSSQQIAHV